MHTRNENGESGVYPIENRIEGQNRSIFIRSITASFYPMLAYNTYVGRGVGGKVLFNQKAQGGVFPPKQFSWGVNCTVSSRRIVPKCNSHYGVNPHSP